MLPDKIIEANQITSINNIDSCDQSMRVSQKKKVTIYTDQDACSAVFFFAKQ